MTYRHQVAKLVGELCPNAAVDDLQHLTLVICVNWKTEVIYNLDGIFQCFHVASHNDSGVHISFQEGLRHVEHFTSCSKQSPAYAVASTQLTEADQHNAISHSGWTSAPSFLSPLILMLIQRNKCASA